MELTKPITHETEHNVTDTTVFGFWVYILTDCMLFAGLFAAYAVLHNSTYASPSIKEVTNLPFILAETLILLTSSFTCGLGMLAVQSKNKKMVLALFGATLILGLSFVGMELTEFSSLIREGSGPQQSAFLSSFFTLVGTHGLHVALGSLWMIVLMAQVFHRGVTPFTARRLTCLSMFWHFLDIIWIFIFTLVYLMGAL